MVSIIFVFLLLVLWHIVLESQEQNLQERENENKKMRDEKTRLDGGNFTLQTQVTREIELRKSAEKEKTTLIQKIEELEVRPGKLVDFFPQLIKCLLFRFLGTEKLCFAV